MRIQIILLFRKKWMFWFYKRHIPGLVVRNQKCSNRGIMRWKVNKAKVYDRKVKFKSTFDNLLNKYVNQKANSRNQPNNKRPRSPTRQERPESPHRRLLGGRVSYISCILQMLLMLQCHGFFTSTILHIRFGITMECGHLVLLCQVHLSIKDGFHQESQLLIDYHTLQMINCIPNDLVQEQQVLVQLTMKTRTSGLPNRIVRFCQRRLSLTLKKKNLLCQRKGEG